MENIQIKKQKLSLSSPLHKLQSTLWEQKKQNHILEKENLILNTKINSIQKVPFQIMKNPPSKQNSTNDKIADHKQRLQQLYQEIKQQQTWIKNTVSLIEEKKLQKEQRRKYKIQKKLIKTNKKCKQASKRLNYLQKKIEKEGQILKQSPYFLAQIDNSQNLKEISPNDVICELEKEHQQLNLLLQYKENQLVEENRKVKGLNCELIELLELKNYLKKYVNEQTKKTLFCGFSSFSQKSEQNMPRNIKFNTINGDFQKNKKPVSFFKRQPKLKITTY